MRYTDDHREPAGIGRRTFLRDLAVVSAAAATVSAEASPQDAATQRADHAAAPAWRKAPCTLCGVGCGLLVGIDRGRAVGARGDPESATGRGLACVKGYHAVQTLYGSGRRTRAMVRRGGALVPASLDEALDLVARRLREVARRHGDDSIALYGAPECLAADSGDAVRRFVQLRPGSTVESSGRVRGAGAAAAFQASFGTSAPVATFDDIDRADVFVLWSSNLAETAPVLFSRMLERRRVEPAVRIIDVGTRTTRTSYAADRAILHAPHGALAVANALACEIVARDWVHDEFVGRNVAFRRGDVRPLASPAAPLAPESSRDARRADFDGFIRQYTPQWAQRVAGIPAADVRWLAALYGDPALKVLSVWDDGINRHARSAWTGTALCNLHLLTGKVAAPGNGPLCIAPLAAGAVAPVAGRDAIALFDAVARGGVHFLWIAGADPAGELPNGPRDRRALEQHDCFVVVSEAYPTAASAVADVVLPATLWLEADAIVHNADRRAQRVPRLVAAPGDAESFVAQLGAVLRRGGPVPLASAPAAAARPPVAAPWRPGSGSRARVWLRPYQEPADRPDAAFPFWLEVGPVLEHSGTGALTRRVPVLHRAVPRAYVEMHRLDAARLGIRTGDRVRVASRRGALELEARIDYRSQPPRGQLFIPDFDGALPVMRLMSGRRCPHSGQPEAGACAVRITRTSGGGAP